MIIVPFAHVGGIPIEETLGTVGPALLVGFKVAWAKLRARLRPMRSRARAHAPAQARGRAMRAGQSDYEAGSADAVRETLRRAGPAFERVAEAVTGPTSADPPGPPRERHG